MNRIAPLSNHVWNITLVFGCLTLLCHGWVQLPTRHLTRHQSLLLSSSTTIHSSPDAKNILDEDDKNYKNTVGADNINNNNNNIDNDDGDDEEEEEYEYVEYEILTEPEFMSSEWLVGTCMDGNPNKIVETWVRLATDKNGKNVAIWGDGAQGTWSFDVANQFLSMSKENLFGKNIWAGVVDDYYFTYGTVRGWSFISPAAVRGQWQAKRLGVDPDEAGTPPWFDISEEGTPKLQAQTEEEE